jgi:hypothetical protein
LLIMENLSQADKLLITVDIANKLKNFEGPNGKVNLYNDSYSFVKELKQIFKNYINGDRGYKGSLNFVEIGKVIDYNLPQMKNKDPLFVIRMK